MAKVVFFAFDVSEASQVRRIAAVRRLGHDVASYAFRRGNMNRGFRPDWPDVDLGTVPNRAPGRRLASLFPALVRILRRRRLAQGSDLWIARNLDLLLLAHATRALTGHREVKIVYECLDIHGLLTRRDALGRFLRGIERTLMARSDLLVTSSPGFVRAYFEGIQDYGGPVALIENKLWFGDHPIPRPRTPRQRPADAPLVIGSVGSIRCAPSLSILAETARRMGQDVHVAFHGNVHRHAVPEFDQVIAAHPNMSYHGPYRYPDDLQAIYAGCDLVWSQDLWQAGANSDWLLPNRIYEASWFGCPSIAVAGTETARRVADRGLGFVIAAPSADALVRRLATLGREEIAAVSGGILDRDDGEFRLHYRDIAPMLAPIGEAVGSPSADAVVPTPCPADRPVPARPADGN